MPGKGPNNPTGRFGKSGGRGPQTEEGKFGDRDTGSPSLPKDGRLQRSGSGQPDSDSPSLSQTHGQTARPRPNSGRPKNLTGFDKARATGTLINDLRIKRMRSYMSNPITHVGRAAKQEGDTNRPSKLPSKQVVTHGGRDRAIPQKRTTPPGKTTRGDAREMIPVRNDALVKTRKGAK